VQGARVLELLQIALAGEPLQHARALGRGEARAFRVDQHPVARREIPGQRLHARDLAPGIVRGAIHEDVGQAMAHHVEAGIPEQLGSTCRSRMPWGPDQRRGEQRVPGIAWRSTAAEISQRAPRSDPCPLLDFRAGQSRTAAASGAVPRHPGGVAGRPSVGVSARPPAARARRSGAPSAADEIRLHESAAAR
jgi:hypothetical protein